jgi:TusA-related sulfurtransferase
MKDIIEIDGVKYQKLAQKSETLSVGDYVEVVADNRHKGSVHQIEEIINNEISGNWYRTKKGSDKCSYLLGR